MLPALGLWACAHADGEIHLRQLRAVTAAAHKFPSDPNDIPSVDAHHPSAVIEVCWPAWTLPTLLGCSWHATCLSAGHCCRCLLSLQSCCLY